MIKIWTDLVLPQCTRLTDRQTNKQTFLIASPRRHSMQRGKKSSIALDCFARFCIMAYPALLFEKKTTNSSGDKIANVITWTFFTTTSTSSAFPSYGWLFVKFSLVRGESLTLTLYRYRYIATFSLRKVPVYLQPLLRNPPINRPNSVKLRNR